MGDSAAALWESELLRARQWLAATRRDKQQESERLFKCVKAHIGYKDHQCSLQSEAAASDDEDDTALDFLGDVDMSDMNALLQAEAAKITETPPVELVTTVESSMPSARDLMKPLEMPSNLTSPKLKPKTKAVPMSQLNPKTVTTSVTGSATLGDEASVHALMEDLSVDVTHLQHSDTEEGKTEESTPPHLLKNFGRSNGTDTGATQTKKSGVEHSKYMQQVSSKSPQAPHKKTAEAPATSKMDEVGAEMLSWVSGYRDPEVIRRKENMRRKRKHTNRYGMTSEEEQRQAMLQVKQITRDSDSESEDDYSSDYSPAEDEEIPEPDEPEVVDLLSDDYLDSDEDKRPVKRKRKRLRQSETTTKKRSRSRKPAVTRKVTQQDSPTNSASPPGTVQEAQPSDAKNHHIPARANSASIAESDDDTTGKSDYPIELTSSGDETGDSDKASTLNESGIMSKTNHSGDSNSVESEVAHESTVLRLKIPKNFKNPQERLQRDSPTKLQQKQSTQTGSKTASQKIDGNTGNAVADGDAFPETGSSLSVVHESTRLKDPTETLDVTVDDNADDADLSDAGTVDLEGEVLSLENVTNTRSEEGTATEVSSTVTEKEAPSLNVGDKPTEVEVITSDVEQRTGVSDEDISEAETEILDDDEPDTDDLGLDYSDDSDSGSKALSESKNGTGNQMDGTATKKDGAISEGKTSSEGNSNSNSKEKPQSGKKENKIDASTAGVQQFFVITPPKLKPKAKITTSTAPKPLPVHNYAETHLMKGNNDAGRSTAENNKSSVTPTKPPVGSNGLRSKKISIATTTTMKGRFAVTRRSTKMLNPEDTPGAKKQKKNQYTMVPTQKSNKNTLKDLDDVPLSILAKEMSKAPDDKPTGKYLSYTGAKKTEDVPTFSAEKPRIVPKSRFGGGGGFNSITQNSSMVSNGHSQMNGKIAPQDGYRREPQISIYDALHMEGQESVSDIRDGTGFKRPSRFKKMQEEAARNGTPMVKSRLQDTDWDKVPIPKKKKQAPQVNKSTQNGVLPTPSKTSDYESKNTPGKALNTRRKKNSGPSNKNSGTSYYGPQATSGKYDSPSRGRRGREHSSNRRDDSRRKRRSLSPPPRDRDRYDRHDDRRRRGASRSRSRSPSPRSRDYSSSRHRRRSRSRSWSREKSSERDYRRSASSGRDRDQQVNGSRGLRSPDNQGTSKKAEPPELGEVCQNGKIDDTDKSVKKQKKSHYSEAPPSPGALATFDDDDDNMFISDSDDDGNAFIKEVEDIRFDLDTVPVDEALIARQVYVMGFNPTVCAEQIEEDFARFGVAIDRDTRFPAIDIFPCQRNHLGRGDACVTFETEEGAQEAVEELNSKNVKNSMIRVRLMDVHTQRILTVQFQTVRDTWKCTGAQCRADVSIWNAKCDKCGRKRVYGPSNIKIGPESWLCSLCFTANDSFASSCHGCMESLPEVDRSAFYTS